MTPVRQTVFGYPNGNCFAACVASLLEMPIEDMPSIENRHFTVVWEEWLRERGLAMVDVLSGFGAFIPGYCIAVGNSPRGGVTASGRPTRHAVICEDMKPVFDPHPDDTFLEGKPIEYTILIPRDPKQLIKRSTHV